MGAVPSDRSTRAMRMSRSLRHCVSDIGDPPGANALAELADMPKALATTVDRPNAGSAVAQQVADRTEPAHFSLRDGYLRVSTARGITGPGYSNYWTSTDVSLLRRRSTRRCNSTRQGRWDSWLTPSPGTMVQQEGTIATSQLFAMFRWRSLERTLPC
jgi:hypothetical protein